MSPVSTLDFWAVSSLLFYTGNWRVRGGPPGGRGYQEFLGEVGRMGTNPCIGCLPHRQKWVGHGRVTGSIFLTEDLFFIFLRFSWPLITIYILVT